MPPKVNSNKWSDVQLAIAAISMTAVIAFWNMFAGPDKVQNNEKAETEQQASVIPTVTPTAFVETPVPEITMPPLGYTILFGGVAPQPQVIVVKKPNGGEDPGNSEGSSSNQPSAPTSSS
jgi:hypothetical protein